MSGQGGEIIKDSFVWDFKMWLLAVLIGDRIKNSWKKWWLYYRSGRRAGFHCTQDTTEYYVQDTMLSINWLKNVSLVTGNW